MGEYDKTIVGMLVCGSSSLHGSIIFQEAVFAVKNRLP
jgi:hypothetical protein